MHRRRCVLKMRGRRTTKEGIEGLSDGRTEDGYEKSRRAGDLAFVRKEMNQIYSVLLSRKHKAGPAGNMVSLP